jgi:hypothetical protein
MLSHWAIFLFPVSQTRMKSLWVLGDVSAVRINGDETKVYVYGKLK